MPDAETNTQNAYDLIGAGKAFGYYGNTSQVLRVSGKKGWSRYDND